MHLFNRRMRWVAAAGRRRRDRPGRQRERRATAHRDDDEVHAHDVPAARAGPADFRHQPGDRVGDLLPPPVAAPAAGELRDPHRRSRDGPDASRLVRATSRRRPRPRAPRRSTGSTRTSRAAPWSARSPSPPWTSATRTRSRWSAASQTKYGEHVAEPDRPVPRQRLQGDRQRPVRRGGDGHRDSGRDRRQRRRWPERRAVRLLERLGPRERPAQLLLHLQQGQQGRRQGGEDRLVGRSDQPGDVRGDDRRRHDRADGRGHAQRERARSPGGRTRAASRTPPRPAARSAARTSRSSPRPTTPTGGTSTRSPTRRSSTCSRAVRRTPTR